MKFIEKFIHLHSTEIELFWLELTFWATVVFNRCDDVFCDDSEGGIWFLAIEADSDESKLESDGLPITGDFWTLEIISGFGYEVEFVGSTAEGFGFEIVAVCWLIVTTFLFGFVVRDGFGTAIADVIGFVTGLAVKLGRLIITGGFGKTFWINSVFCFHSALQTNERK